jgi:puromycin-sensitive aminopeptidase
LTCTTSFDAVTTDLQLEHLDPYRLPRTVVPSRYDIRLEPRLDTAAFSGRVRIIAEAVEATRVLVLNAEDLVVHGATVNGRPADAQLLPDTARLALTVSEPVGPGEVEVVIDFDGILNDKLKGFYRSTFTDPDGVEQVIATTQMQATDCRRAFPCWDEPDFKAVFGVTLVIDDGLTAISNGPEVGRRTLDDGRVEVQFADTMTMSSYLVAFVVGPLEVTDPIDVDGTPLRVVHLPGKGHLTGFALDIAAGALRWFQDYYGIPYADQKIDLVAIPDFAAGAMENTGCITFRENLLLVDPASATLAEQMLVADVICHELAHMWFGNLVTMRWWNGIWLNEAFATFMEVECEHHLRPEWRRWDVFSLERTMAFDTDSLASTRPIEFPVRSPQDCEGMFDVLTYQKGGAILRMLQQYLGVDRFRDGVRHYLATHAFANTETGDLWDAIERSVVATGGDEPVRRLMDSWIWQPGYPLVTASIDGSELVLDQQRFSFGDDTTDPATWVIPLHVRVGTTTHSVLLDGGPIRLGLDAVDAADSTIVVNAGGHGFLRVAYSSDLLGRLSGPALRDLDPVERYGVVDDAWNATVAGRVSAVDLLTLLRGFTDEDDLSVWQAIVGAFTGLSRLVTEDARDALRAHIRSTVGPALDRVGWEPDSGESERTGRLRGLLVVAAAVHGGDADAQARCRALAETARRDPDAVHPELQAAAITTLAATGDADTFDLLVEGFRTATTPQAQLRNLYSLAELPSADLIQRVCDFAFSGEVRTQNAPFLVNLCIAHRDHGAVAWRSVRENWEKANADFPSSTIPRMVSSVRLLNTPELEADVRGFFGEHGIPQATKTLEQILERQSVNVALRQREGATLSAHLTSG